MTEKVRRYKTTEELDGDELLKQVQARRRGEPEPRFETEDYRKAKREHLQEGGFEPDDSPGDEPKPLEEMSVEDHLARIRRPRP